MKKASKYKREFRSHEIAMILSLTTYHNSLDVNDPLDPQIWRQMNFQDQEMDSYQASLALSHQKP